jgi:retinol dehydrogenase-14
MGNGETNGAALGSPEVITNVEQIHRGPMAGRTVLVTGGTGGIGRATALGLATMGAHLAITGRDRGRAEGAAREIRAAGGGQVDVFVADLSAQSEVRRLADEVLQSLSRIDVLVNNAGGTGTPRAQPRQSTWLRRPISSR